MATDVERLAIVIEAQTRQFERKITQLERQMDGSMRRSASSVGRLDRSFRSAAASAATFMRSFAVGAAAAAFSGLPVAINRAISATADLGNAANRAGASAEGLQVLRRGLEQNGASAADADDAMRRLTRRMGEFANSGAGPAKNAIEGLGLEVFNLDGTLRTSDEILRQIAGRFGDIENPAIAAAYAAQLFGDDAGPRLVPLLMQGERALDSFEAQLRDANALMSNDSVQAAIAMDDAYSRLIDNMGLRWMTFVVETVQGVQDFVGTIRTAANALNDLFESSQTPQDRLQSALASRGRGWSVQGDADFAGYFDRSSFNMPSNSAGVDIVDPRQAQALRDLQGQLASTEDGARRITTAFDLFGDTSADAAQRAGTALRDEVSDPLALTTDAMTSNLDRLGEESRRVADSMGSYFGDMFTGLIDGTQEWDDALKNLASNLASNLLNSSLSNLFQSIPGMGGGGGGGFLSGLMSSFGGMFANGGTLGAGQWGIAGESGGMQHAEVIHGPAGITPLRNLMAANSNSSGSTQINMNIGVSGSVSQAEMRQLVSAALQQVRSEMPGVAVKAVAEQRYSGAA